MEKMGLNALFGGDFAGRRVLVTGHTGFKGSWLVQWLQAMEAKVAGLALDPERTRSHWELLGLDLELDARVDLRDLQGVSNVLATFRPELIIHLAAQALVLRSYREPQATYEVNVSGLINLFEAVRKCDSVRAIINVTTDKVYKEALQAVAYSESDALGGCDPYSASKACAEIISNSYRLSFFVHDDGRGFPVKVATARAGNVVGGGDWAEDRLVPDLVRAATRSTPLVLRHPFATRPWQHVLEPLSGYLVLGAKLLRGESVDEAWNFGPSADALMQVDEIVRRMQLRWRSFDVSYDPGPHPHEAKQLSLDCTKSMRRLGWYPVWNADTTLCKTIDWYRAFESEGAVYTSNDIVAYVADARRAGLVWAE